MKAKEFKDFKSIKDRVQHLLEINHNLRDSDEELLGSYWFKELGAEQIESMTAYEFLATLSFRKLTSFKSIVRKREMLQAENENLRGSQYKVRKRVKGSTFRVAKEE